MNKEIIPVSPIIDHTEEAVLTGNRKKKSRAKAKQAFAYVISAMLSANLLLCSWGYIKENISSESFGDKLIYEIYYGGMLKNPPRQRRKAQTQLQRILLLLFPWLQSRILRMWMKQIKIRRMQTRWRKPLSSYTNTILHLCPKVRIR